jgi:hypothetical protein
MSDPDAPPLPVNDKEDLEKKKLQLEIENLQSPFYKKAEWWAKSLPVPFGLLTIVLTVWYVGLQERVKTLSSGTVRLTAEKAALKADVDGLRADKSKLETERSDRQKQVDELTDRLASESFQVHLDPLEKGQRNNLFSKDLPIPIADLVRFEQKDAPNRERNLTSLQRAFETSKNQAAKAFISIALFEVTQDRKWRDTISDELIETIKPRRTFDLRTSFSDADVEAQFVIVSYVGHLKESEELSFGEQIFFDVNRVRGDDADVDLAAVRAFRQMWGDPNLDVTMEAAVPNQTLVGLIAGAIPWSRNALLKPNSSWGQRSIAIERLRVLSHEACAVVMAEKLRDPQLRTFDRSLFSSTLQLPPEQLNKTGAAEFSAIPRTLDQDEWSSWAADNVELMKLYLEPGMKDLMKALKTMIYDKARP